MLRHLTHPVEHNLLVMRISMRPKDVALMNWMVRGLLFSVVLVIVVMTGWQFPVRDMLVSWYFWLSVRLTVRTDEEEREYPLMVRVRE